MAARMRIELRGMQRVSQRVVEISAAPGQQPREIILQQRSVRKIGKQIGKHLCRVVSQHVGFRGVAALSKGTD